MFDRHLIPLVRRPLATLARPLCRAGISANQISLTGFAIGMLALPLLALGAHGWALAAILCNPPFHQQHAITDHIAWQMFNDARRSLKYGGELYVVGNRHLDYFRKLKRAFGNCTTIATNNKFVVLKATKVRKQR